MTTEQIAVRLPEELLARLDELVGRRRYENRTAAVRVGLELISEIERQRDIDDAIVDGYARVPPTVDENTAALESLRASIQEEPW